jgi:ABC-2 type transport system permease protein
VLKKYKKVSDHVKLVTKDPVVYPNFSKQFVDDTVSDNDVIVVNETTGAAKYISNEDMYYSSQYSYYSTDQYLDVEGQVTSAIQNVLSTDVKKIYMVTGHSEQEISDTLSSTLDKMNVDVESISLVTEEKVPDDCNLLIVDGPQTDLRDSEKTLILDYLKAGGDAILMTGYVEDETPNLDEILDYYGIGIQKGYILEGAGHYENYLNWIVPTINTEADVMSAFGDNDYVIMGSAQSLTTAKSSSLRSTLSLTKLLTTSKQSLLKVDPSSGKSEKEKGDLDGPFTTGVYAEETVDDETTKLTVLSTEQIQETLFQNVISAMIDDGDGSTQTTSIEAKNLSYSSITMSVTSQIFWTILLIIVIPVALLVIGFVIWFVRRRK